MAAASIARRSAFLRAIWRTTTNSISAAPPPPPPLNGLNFIFQKTRISPRSPSRLRRESLFLNSLLPVHSAIASACLVSKLPNEASTSSEDLLTISAPSRSDLFQKSASIPPLEFSFSPLKRYLKIDGRVSRQLSTDETIMGGYGYGSVVQSLAHQDGGTMGLDHK